jgi:hypothetical protein
MQTQYKTNNGPVHIKVALNGEFRRFLLTEISYAKLEEVVKSLFQLTYPVSLRFQDDEKDWVHVTTDEELHYAVDLAGSPLRLEVKILSASPQSSATAQIPCVPAGEVEEECFRGGRGRGCRGRGGWRNPEKLEAMENRMVAKVQALNEKLNSGNLTSERERTVRWKLARLQEKLEHVKEERAKLANAPPEQKEAEDLVQQPAEGWCARGGRGRGGRRGGRGEGCPRGGMKARLPPEIMENFHQAKSALQAAKEKGDKQEIQACKEALWAAKSAKFAAMDALRAGEGQESKGI